MNNHLKLVIIRLSGLLRTRVIMACLGLYILHLTPEAGQWITAIIGLSLGISAIDAFKEVKGGQ